MAWKKGSFYIARSVRCPVCFAGVSHWCREVDGLNKGKCCLPHAERTRRALDNLLAPLQPLPLSNGRKFQDGEKEKAS